MLLLDEPAAGVPREESKDLFAAIAGLSRDITVLFIEHDMDLVFRFASRVIVMVGGRVLVEGTPAEIASDPRVRAVYLGKGHHDGALQEACRDCAVTAPLLSFDDVRAGYGPAVVLDGVSFALPERGGLAVLGRNGVGKSTLLLTIMGYTQVSRGRILWRGDDITALPPHRRALAGIGWVAQEREIFPSLTVEENLTVAARAGRWDLPAVYDLFPRLAERRRNFGNQLSGGEQQMLAIARALMTNPALLLLDEPLEGLGADRRRRACRGHRPHDPGRHLRLHPGRAACRARFAADAARARPRTRPDRPQRPLGGAPFRPRHARPADRPAAGGGITASTWPPRSFAARSFSPRAGRRWG